jgi:hypothetical protein
MDRALYQRPPLSLGALRDGRQLVTARGTIHQLLPGRFEIPRLPPGAPPIDRIAVARVDVEQQPFLSRPLRQQIDRGRPFVLRDATGEAVVRIAPDNPPESAGDEGRLREDFDLRLLRPFVHGTDGPDGQIDLYLRAVAIGDDVVVAGAVHVEIAPSGHGQGGYRQAPSIPVIEAVALFDPPAWSAAAEWHALPWYRKLSLIVRNR